MRIRYWERRDDAPASGYVLVADWCRHQLGLCRFVPINKLGSFGQAMVIDDARTLEMFERGMYSGRVVLLKCDGTLFEQMLVAYFECSEEVFVLEPEWICRHFAAEIPLGNQIASSILSQAWNAVIGHDGDYLATIADPDDHHIGADLRGSA